MAGFVQRYTPGGSRNGHLHDAQATVGLMVVIIRAAISRTRMLVFWRVSCWLRDMGEEHSTDQENVACTHEAGTDPIAVIRSHYSCWLNNL